MINLFAIDDHFLIIEGLYKTFDPVVDQISLVGSAFSVEEALVKIPETHTDIIVLDLFLNDTSPVSNFRQLKSAFPSIPIVVLTMEDSLRWQVKMFKLGVMGFLTKTGKKETMVSVFNQVYHGNTVIPKNVSSVLFPHEATRR